MKKSQSVISWAVVFAAITAAWLIFQTPLRRMTQQKIMAMVDYGLYEVSRQGGGIKMPDGRIISNARALQYKENTTKSKQIQDTFQHQVVSEHNGEINYGKDDDFQFTQIKTKAISNAVGDGFQDLLKNIDIDEQFRQNFNN